MKHFFHYKINTIIIFYLLLAATISHGQVKVEGLLYNTNQPVSIEIKDGKIESVQQIDKLSEKNNPVYIAPGLIDNQVNGFAGVSFTFGGSELTADGIKKATRKLWEKGVTTYLPTLTTNSQEVLLKNFSILNSVRNDEELLGSIAGFHLEGPYISPENGYRGAHPLKHVRKPNWNEFLELYEASGKGILTVTVAPDQDGAMDFISKCTHLGIIVALGHHNADKTMIDEAVLNGARTATHLGNGCANMISRRDNPLWPQLANDQLMASIICDGFHLRDEQIAVFYKVKGTEKTIITSDVTGFASLPPGEYRNEDNEIIELTNEGLLRYPAQNVLYGSACPISRGVVKIMKVTGCTLGEAVQMASTNPAKLYGLNDRGELEPGKRADLILFTVSEKDLNIKETYVAGQLVYKADL